MTSYLYEASALVVAVIKGKYFDKNECGTENELVVSHLGVKAELLCSAQQTHISHFQVIAVV